MPVTASVQAAGGSHPGLLRASNEDRIHFDVDRGIYVVIDGVGGQAAGEKAADTALAKIRERLEAGRGAVETRVRDAITAANNEVYRLASLRPDWKGMACVLTVAVVDDDGTAVVGHVGDTRLYKLRRGGIEKLTRDHSPIGEREDAGELSEDEAMRHPRRNEVYRDVGSEHHHADDSDFIDVFRAPFEQDAALLLCSDGLTDGVSSDAINAIVRESAGHPYEVVRALIESANDAGGKDNVSVVYVEGSRFLHEDDTRDLTRRAVPAVEPPQPVAQPPARRGRGRRVALVLALLAASALALYAGRGRWLPMVESRLGDLTRPIVVAPGESIAAAVTGARPGREIIVEPGEYRERLQLAPGVRIRSRVPRGAVIRLPGGATEGDAAVTAIDVGGAELSGFRIVGDAATPLGTGVSLRNAQVALVDLEVTGASVAAVEFATGSRGSLLASELHDNPGLAVLVRAGAAPRIQSSFFARNATAGRTASPLLIEAGATVELRNNIFRGIVPSVLLGPAASAAVGADNVFPDAQAGSPAAPPRPGQRGRR